MSTIVTRPVAVDLKAILKTEGSSPSPTSPRSHAFITPSYGSLNQTSRGAPPGATPRPPLYPAYPSYPSYPSPNSRGPPLQSRTEYGSIYGPPEGLAYQPPLVPTAGPSQPRYSDVLQVTPAKRPPSREGHPYEPAPKKQSKWTDEEDDQLVTLRGEGMKWEEIAKHVPGRSAIACRLHYQNFLERRAAWDEEKKNKLAQLYNRLKGDIWDKIARELHMPWRAVEEMHWRMGRTELAQRAGVREFLATPDPSGAFSASGIPITTSFMPPGPYQHPPPGVYAPSPQSLAPPLPPPHAAYTSSPLPPPPPQLPPGHHSTPQPPQHYIDPPRPPPTFTSGPHSPSHRSHRSASSHASSYYQSGHQPGRSGSDHGSPRRRALSSSRLASASMPPVPMGGRRMESPPPPSTLPPIPSDFSGPPSEPGQGPTLPPVRLLQEEVRDSSRYTTPTHSGLSHSGSGPSRPLSTTSASRSTADQKAESGAQANGR